MFGPAARVVFVVTGVLWMAGMLYAAAKSPRLRPLGVMFASTPAFQLAWAAVVNEKNAVLFVPATLVPLAAFVYCLRAGLRLRDADREARPAPRG